MADEDDLPGEDFDEADPGIEGSEEDFAEEDFDEDDFGEEVFEEEIGDDDEVAVVEIADDEDGDEEETGPRPARKPSDDEEEDDDDVLDPDDIEADLEEILRDRIAAADEEDDDEEEEEAPLPSERTVGSVAPKRSDEWTCPGCFLIVSASQFGSPSNPTCPSGEEPCPSIERL